MRTFVLINQKKLKEPKPRKCKNPDCKNTFVPTFSSLQVVCSIKCSQELAHIKEREKAIKDIDKDIKERKEKLMSHKDYIKLLQITFNTFIRLRDANLPCVSCGAVKCEEFHAGHYVASTYQYLRFNELNVWKQCSKCNTHLRGNLIPYRIELINRIGLDKVEELENNRHKELKLTIPEIKEKIAEYKEKIKILKSNKVKSEIIYDKRKSN